MKIVHLLESIDPATGGPVKSVSSLAVAQALQGHEVILLCYREPEYEAFARLIFEAVPASSSFRIQPVSPERGLGKLVARSARCEFETMFSGVNVVHVHGVWRPFNMAACQVAIRMSRTLIVTPHGMLDPWSLGQKYWKKKLFMALVWRKLLNEANFIHALNDDEARLLLPLSLSAPVKVFPNGVFPEQYKELPDPKIFKQTLPDLKNQPYILFLSRLHYKKGLDYLVNAFELLCQKNEHIQLVIAGPDDGMLPSVRRWVAEKGLQHRVHLVGSLHGTMKFSAFSGATCFCLPSRQEGFSIAICEALISRVPVVISEQCHFPEVAEVGAGLVVPLVAKEIAQGLMQVIANHDSRNTAGEAGHALMSSRYSWHAISSRMTDEYANA